MKGVIATRAPEATVVDLTHGIPPQAVLLGALVLRQAVPYFPKGTIHVAVVDPGVGTERRALCVVTNAGCLVGPDNGVLSLAADAVGIRRIIELTETRFFLEPRSATFHGRDVFAPVAAALAAGTLPSALGRDRSDLDRIAPPEPVHDAGLVRGEVVYVDHFGNLVSNLPPQVFPRVPFVVTVGDVRVGSVTTTYADVPVGTTTALVSSYGLLEIAVRNGSARDTLGLAVGAPVVLRPA